MKLGIAPNSCSFPPMEQRGEIAHTTIVHSDYSYQAPKKKKKTHHKSSTHDL